jgi:hypothetical protein
MRLGGWLIALVLSTGVISCGQAFASEPIARPVFTADREFGVAADENATHLTDASMPIDLWIFDRALERCALKADEVRGKLSAILDKNSSLWESLDRLFPGSRQRIAQRKVRVVIDDFSDFAGNAAPFSSYFTDIDVPTIGLDCQPVERSYWLRSLAHEMTHALLYQKGVQSGFEEGLAQLIEHYAGGEQPELTLKHLEKAAGVPTVLEESRPLPSRESYAVQYLFVSYIRQEFGGWPTLRAMADTDPELWSNGIPVGFDQSPDFLSQATCRARAYLNRVSPGFFAAEKMTREGVLRYFFMALAMNNSKSSHYQILGWSGFSKLPARPRTNSLVPGQAAIFTDAQAIRGLPVGKAVGLEVYCVELQASQKFKITDFLERSEEFPMNDQKSAFNYCLAINLGQAAIAWK